MRFELFGDFASFTAFGVNVQLVSLRLPFSFVTEKKEDGVIKEKEEERGEDTGNNDRG